MEGGEVGGEEGGLGQEREEGGALDLDTIATIAGLPGCEVSRHWIGLERSDDGLNQTI